MRPWPWRRRSNKAPSAGPAESAAACEPAVSSQRRQNKSNKETTMDTTTTPGTTETTDTTGTADANGTATAAESKLALTEDNVKQVLKQVDDPELGINIIDLGLVYETRVLEDKDVQIVMTLTTPFCPIGPSVKQQINILLHQQVEGVDKVDVQFTFNPPWDKDMMSEDAKMELGIF